MGTHVKDIQHCAVWRDTRTCNKEHGAANADVNSADGSRAGDTGPSEWQYAYAGQYVPGNPDHATTVSNPHSWSKCTILNMVDRTHATDISTLVPIR